MPSLSGEKTPLKMTVCTETDGVVSPGDTSVSLLINPAELKLTRNTLFNRRSPMGDPGTGKKFSHMEPVKLDFDATFDGTGVVPRPSDATMPRDVEGQLDALLKVVYTYNGTRHQPNIVQILWGSLLFVGRLTSLSTAYTLFKPSGAPLRAKVGFKFDAYKSTQESRLLANPSSPDLSHIVEVRAGDTLPLLCHRIYGDSRYYQEVARINGLLQFRALQPGLQLHFPPLA
ncbi:MAG: peptidoglycan-binding protein [Burkholderiales bacterium]|nr:peptidoglycan-binding protein [Burkholderiales bacterium]